MLRDRSHACVITWSLGNESSHGRNIDAAARWVRETDPSRPVQYESCGGGDATDIIAPMCVPPPLPCPSSLGAISLPSASLIPLRSVGRGGTGPAWEDAGEWRTGLGRKMLDT